MTTYCARLHWPSCISPGIRQRSNCSTSSSFSIPHLPCPKPINLRGWHRSGAQRYCQACRRCRSWHGFRERRGANRQEEHTSELQSLMRITDAVFCLKKKKTSATLGEFRNVNPDYAAIDHQKGSYKIDRPSIITIVTHEHNELSTSHY